MIADNTLIAEEIARRVMRLGGCAYYVGGYVRDKLMHIESKDIDIEVHNLPSCELEAVLDSMGKRKEVGKSFGVYTLCGYNIDIAMPRKEISTGEGHRDFRIDVEPYLGTKKAAMRRDFTINAIMQNILTGEIIDHFGGIEDIEKGIIHHVDDEAFAEDPLRVLRAAQFAARFKFVIAEETISLCKEMDLSHLAGERVFEELKKALLKAEKPSLFFENMRKMDALSLWFKELENLIGIMQNKVHHREGDAWVHTMMVADECASYRSQVKNPFGFMLAGIAHDMGKAVCTEETDGIIRALNHEKDGIDAAKQFLRRITDEKKLIRYVLNMVELHMQPNMLYAQNSSIKATNKLFDKAVEPKDLIYLAMADCRGKIPQSADSNTEKFLLERLGIYNEYMEREYVTGKDLISLGIQEGAVFKELLSYARKLRLSGVKKEAALKQVEAYRKQILNEKKKGAVPQ